jgi:hypothetical protein
MCIKNLILESFENYKFYRFEEDCLNIYQIEGYVQENTQVVLDTPIPKYFEQKLVISDILSELERIGELESRIIKGYPFILYRINKSKIRDNKINEILDADRTR